MRQWTFRNNAGNLAVVSAQDEKEARAKAMEKLHGPIKTNPHWLGKEWIGSGLILQGVSDD